MDTYIKNEPCHECGSSTGVGVYQRENGDYYGNCFGCGEYTSDPFGEGGRVVEDSEFVEDVLEEKQEERKKKFEKEFNESIVGELLSRGISKEACKKYSVRSVVEGGKDVVHLYPHTKLGTTVSHMRRGVSDKSFMSYGDTKNLEFFGQSVCGSGGKMIIVTEGQCLTPETEVLTPKGWVKLESYNNEDVLQVDNDLHGSFIKPIAVVDKLFTGKMIDRGNSKGFSEEVTEDHSVARIKDGKLVKQRGDSTKNRHYLAPRCLNSYNKPTDTNYVTDDLIKLMVAYQADGTDRGSSGYDFGFKKQAKIDRIEEILKYLALEYKRYRANKGGVTVFRISKKESEYLPSWVWSKSFSIKSMLSFFNSKNMEVFVREVKHWDGNIVKNRDQDEYNNTDLDTIQAVQLASHMSGYCSTIRVKSKESSNFYKESNKERYVTSILYSKSTSSVQQSPTITRVVNKRVMCLQVPTGFFLMRQNGNISITGNCDTLAAFDLLQRMGKNYRVVSVVNGSNSAVKCFKDNYQWVNTFDSIFLAFDQDEPGQKAVEKISALFPPNKVKNLVFSEKDPNELLREDKHQEFLSSIFTAKESRPDGIVSVDDIFDEAIKPPVMGKSFPWDTLTDVTYGYRTKEIYGIGAGSGAGKTEAFKEMINHTIYHHKEPAGVIFLEEPAHKTLKVLAGKRVNKRFHIPADKGGDWTIEELTDGINDLRGKVYLYNHFGSKDWGSIEAKIRYMVVVLGIKDIYLDHLTALVAQEDNEYKALNRIMEEMASLVQDLDCTIFYISHLRKAAGTPHEEGGHVSADQFKGSGAIVYWSNFLFGIERNQQADDVDERNTSVFRVLKDRNTGIATGTHFKLRYDHSTGRWDEYSDESEFDEEEFE